MKYQVFMLPGVVKEMAKVHVSGSQLIGETLQFCFSNFAHIVEVHQTVACIFKALLRQLYVNDGGLPHLKTL